MVSLHFMDFISLGVGIMDHYTVLHCAGTDPIYRYVQIKMLWHLLCCSSARQSHALDEAIVAWRVISKQILLRP
jgi:hypothetical protein